MSARKDMPKERHEKTPLKSPRGEDDGPVLLHEPITWLHNLVTTYSWKLLAMVACTNHLLKGFIAGGGDSGLLGAPMEFLFKEHKVNGGQMQVYMAIAASPWALKPLIGLLSDSCPIFGYRKRPYILITAVAGFCGVAALAFSGAKMSLNMVVLCLFLAFLMVATADLLVDAKQSAEVKKSPRLGPDFFLFTWLGILVGMICATLLVGPIIQHWSPHACYLVALPFLLPIFWPTLMNYMGEERLQDNETMVSRVVSNFRRHPAMCWLCVGMGTLLSCVTLVTFHFPDASERSQALSITFAAAIILVAIGMTIRFEIAGPLIFWFMLQACPKVDGALFYFYTDGVKAFPGGPHFSPWMYATGMGLAGLLGVLAGYLSGSVLFKNWRYTSLMLLTVPSRALVRLLLLPVLWRWTTSRYEAGLYTDVYWIFPVEFLSSMLFSWSWIPKQVMNAHLTPEGNEATMLALTAGTFNLGSIMASFTGCWLLSSFSVCADGDTGDAAALVNLWQPYLVSVMAPVLTLVALPFCIPHKLQTEVLITERPDSCTYGALLDTTQKDEETTP